MARKKPAVTIETYGIYSQWDRSSKELPQIREFTHKVPAVIDIEFGFVVRIVGGKNCKLDFCIHHPGILDADGNVRSPFDGQVHVKTNDWQFYLGDTIWEPIHDKLGTWRMTINVEGHPTVEQSFHVFAVED